MSSASNNSSAAQNSPRGRQSRRNSAARGMPSPSSPSGIVDQEHIFSEYSDSLPVKEANIELGEDGLDSVEDFQLETKKPVWNKPSNGEASAVMGAEAWPALGESARSSPKSSSAYSLKALSSPPPASVNATPQDLVVGSLSSPKEVISSISSPNSYVAPSRQRRESAKRHPIDNLSPASQPQQSFVVDMPSHSTGKSGEPSKDNSTNKEGGERGGSYSVNDSQPQRTFRRNNSGPLTRGDGSYHGSHSGRRDQERGKQDWGHRSFNGRDNHGPQQRTGSRPFLRGPSPNTPFVTPSPLPVRPFVAPVVYTDMPSPPLFYVPGPHPDSLRPMSMVPVPSMFFPMHDPNLPSKIVSQIDYYFSNENLVKDIFLRQNMDGEGWVSIKLIAGFKKVMQLTDNIQLILDAIKVSNVVEVQGDKVRRKNDWMKWIMSPVQNSVMSPPSMNISGQNMLAAHFNNVTLDEKAAI